MIMLLIISIIIDAILLEPIKSGRWFPWNPASQGEEAWINTSIKSPHCHQRHRNHHPQHQYHCNPQNYPGKRKPAVHININININGNININYYIDINDYTNNQISISILISARTSNGEVLMNNNNLHPTLKEKQQRRWEGLKQLSS